MSRPDFAEAGEGADRHAEDALLIYPASSERSQELRVYRTRNGDGIQLQTRRPTGTPVHAITVPDDFVDELRCALDELEDKA